MSMIRKYMRSRFHYGKILEIDFSQLEIYVLAHLSGDPTLKSHLRTGKDLHAISAEALFGPNYTPKMRKVAKQLSFQLQYGAGYKSMAQSNNITEQLAKNFIDDYYARYPKIKAYHDALYETIVSNRVSDGSERTKLGVPAGKSKVQSETGRIYTYVEQDAPEWMRTPKFPGATPVYATFSPTKVKNYQNQGMATGDIVPVIMGKLFRRLNEFNSMHPHYRPVRFINTVHDSFVFDCMNEDPVMREWARIALSIMEDSKNILKQELNIDFTMDLKAEAEYGDNWLDMEELIL